MIQYILILKGEDSIMNDLYYTQDEYELFREFDESNQLSSIPALYHTTMDSSSISISSSSSFDYFWMDWVSFG
ncbi:hypothetical protein M0R04_14870 [Candidatus Dojkabacteria bacterium]|nr:hypothetical protein [Candidatus Dojkabacteria bacterium]